MENNYSETKIKSILENLIFGLVSDRPENPVNYMIEWLQKHGEYTANGLTKKERAELDDLRREVRRYREMDEHHGKHTEGGEAATPEASDDEEGDVVPDLEFEQIAAKKKASMRISVSAEVYGKYNDKGNFKPKVIPKNEGQIQRIKSRILNSFLFCNLDAGPLGVVIDAMDERHFSAGETVINQGDDGDVLFVVEKGDLECFKRISSQEKSEPKFLKNYGPGDAFGELALLYNAPRAATVKAKTNATLWALDRETFNHIVKDSATHKRNKYESFLKSVEVLSTMDPYEIGQIADALRTATYKAEDIVIKEGDFGDIFYIVEEGEAIATKTLEPGKPPVMVKEYKPGDFFGELALIKGEPRAANIIAKTNLKLITLDRNSFKRLLGPLDDILMRNSDKYVKFIKK